MAQGLEMSGHTFDEQLDMYLSSLIEADRIDEENDAADNRCADAVAWAGLTPPQEGITTEQQVFRLVTKQTEIAKYRRDNAFSRGVYAGHTCTPSCRFHPEHAEWMRKEEKVKWRAEARKREIEQERENLRNVVNRQK